MFRISSLPLGSLFSCALATALLVPAASVSAKDLRLLYTFQNAKDGDVPHAGLVRDNAGNFYGATYYGGAYANGNGTVFKLAPDGTKTLLHSFSGGADGEMPSAPLLVDKAGNLYGTTQEGGQVGGCNGFGCGVVFAMARWHGDGTLHVYGWQ
ncbi:MAG TPA: choice-of-anchor tandem repeat GloVer-containing protein [Rhizomicrobium sp.]|jgi:uncharacterized repeat protein (TIGR03803 family)